MSTIKQNLLNMSEYGQKLIEKYRADPKSLDIYRIVTSLIHIEALLDKGRIFLDNPAEEVGEINNVMDTLRRQISEIMKDFDPKDIKDTLNQEARKIETNFINNL